MSAPRLEDRYSLGLSRSTLAIYALVSLLLSVAILLQSRQRGLSELLFWLIAYAVVGLVSLWKPRWSPLVAGALAFLLGIVKTHCAGPNLDLGLGLIALSVAASTLDRTRHSNRSQSVDPAGLALLLLAVWSLISLAFALFRIQDFTPAPGFQYHTYPFNPLRLSSDEAIIRATTGATAVLTWFGLYEYGRRVEIPARALRGVIFGLLAVNAVVLFVQQHIDPFFLLHAGRPIGRLNGVTSYCYALGDAALAFFLLLPAWGALRGRGRLLTASSVALIGYAVAASGSRTALLVMVLAGSLWVANWALRLSGTRRHVAIVLSVCITTFLLGLAAWSYRVTPADHVSLMGRLKMGVERDGLLGHLVVTRLSSYPLVARVVGTYPLSGVGVGLYSAEVGKQRALLTPDLRFSEPYLYSSFAPNQFLNVAAELGLPALIALVTLFVWVGASARSRWSDRWWSDLMISVFGLVVALQLGPSLYASEALLFFWLLMGLAGRTTAVPAGRSLTRISPWPGAWLLAGAAIAGVAGQLLARPSLAVESQWARLRWPMNIALLPPGEGGRWTGPEATFTVRTAASELRLRWHVGDVAAPEYRTQVSFYVDGTLVERSVTGSGPIRESVLPLPDVAGPKRVSVLVAPPFLPGPSLGREDPRRLGIFIHGPGREPWNP